MTNHLATLTAAAICNRCPLPDCVMFLPLPRPDLCPIEAATLAIVALATKTGGEMRICPCGYQGPANRDFLSLDGYVTRRCRRCRLAIRRGGLAKRNEATP